MEVPTSNLKITREALQCTTCGDFYQVDHVETPDGEVQTKHVSTTCATCACGEMAKL